MDGVQVYMGTQWAGAQRASGSEPVTNLTLTAPEVEGAKHTLNFTAMRSAGPYSSVYQAGRVDELDDGVIEVYMYEAMKRLGVPVKRRYEPLTLENFAEIREGVEGYDRIVAQVKTDAELQAWYREALID